MNTSFVTRDLRSPLASAGLAFVAALAAVVPLVYLATEQNVKLLSAVLGGLICLIGAFISGNPRLFCLWGLMVTIPFDLSKRFGTIFLKMGGESSFRAELSDVFLLPLVAFLVRDIWSGRLRGLRIPKVAYFWILIMLMGCVWVFVGPWRMSAAHETVRMAKLTVLFVVVCNELQRPHRVLHCAAGLTLGLAVQASVGLIQYFTGAHLGLELLGETGPLAMRMLETSSVRGERVFRVGAFLSHPNVFGAFLAALLPIVVGLFLLRIGKAYKLFFLATATLGTTALVTTLSRSGWVSFAAAFMLLMFLMLNHRRLRRRSLLAAIAAAAVLLTVSAFFASPITSRIFGSREAAMLGRAEYMRDAWGMITAKPWLGWGLNSYVFAVPPFTQYGARGAAVHYGNWIPPVHNIYLLWWTETGIIGLALHLAFFGGIIWTGVGNLRVKDELLFTINAACLSAMLAFVVDGFFSFSLRFNSILRVYWVLAGIMMAVHYWRLQHPEDRQSAAQAGSPVQTQAPRPNEDGPRCDVLVHP